MANSINEQGFSLMDYIDFMGGFSALGGSGGSFRINSDDVGVPLGLDLSEGFAHTASGGINYNYDLGEQSELSGSYFYSRLDHDLNKSTLRENYLNGDVFSTDEESDQNTFNQGHNLNLNFKTKFDKSLNWITKEKSEVV